MVSSVNIQYITRPFQFQLQIPIRSVVKVSKEKTAKIIPNAVGLATATEKHVSDQLTNYNTTGRFTVPLTFDVLLR